MRHNLSDAASIICESSDLANPELWVARRLRRGEFPGLKIGRDWFMTDQDIEAALAACRYKEPAPEVVEPVSIADGLSARARKLRAS